MIESSDRTSDGTRFVGWFHDADDPYHFMVTAVFEDEIAERTHDSSPASRRFRDAIHAAAVDGVRVRSWEAVAGL